MKGSKTGSRYKNKKNKKIFQKFQTKSSCNLGRWWIIWYGVYVSGIASIIFLVVSSVMFWANYGWIFHEDLSANRILTLEKQIDKKIMEIEQAETELEYMTIRYEELAPYGNEEWEETVKRYIVELNAENQMIVQQTKALVMQQMGYNYVPSYTEREYEDLGVNFRDSLIDEVAGKAEGASILGEGLKAALNAAAEDSSLDNILAGATKGLTEGTAGYIGDKIKGDFLSSVVDVTGFIADTQKKISDMGNVPATAIIQMADKQKEYLNQLQSFVEAERANAEDMAVAFDALCGFQQMNRTLRGMAGEDISSLVFKNAEMETLVQKYYQNQEKMERLLTLVQGENI